MTFLQNLKVFVHPLLALMDPIQNARFSITCPLYHFIKILLFLVALHFGFFVSQKLVRQFFVQVIVRYRVVVVE